MIENGSLEIEATGETVGEAKWLALRELEKLQPGLDRRAVTFQIISEGQRGILGVGTKPARVLARVDPDAASSVEALEQEGELARRARELLERITGEIGVRCRVEIKEDEESLTASLVGSDLGLLIGKHGQTIDAIQYLVSAIVHRERPEERKGIVIDVAGYRERRRERLETLAVRSAEEALATRRPVELEPMTAMERKVVHLRLKEFPGVETRSDGEEPSRYVVILPVRE